MFAALISILTVSLLFSTGLPRVRWGANSTVRPVFAAANMVGQDAAPTSSTATAPAAEFDKLRIEGFDAIYSLDYQTARDRFEKMTRLAPDHPAGFLYLANNLWLETLYKGRRLLTSVYTSGSFYQEVKKEDQVDPKRDRQFNDLIKQAVDAAKARLAKNPKDAEALYYQASALGIRAAYATSVKRSFVRSIGDANESILLHKRVLKLDPEYADSYLSIGLYDYVIGSLPFGWRILARLAGLKGSKTKGIEALEKVVKSGRYTQDDARVVLIGIYNKEAEPERSLDLLTDLATRYPRNYLFRVEQASMLYRLGRAEEGDRVFADLTKDKQVADVATDLVYYTWGVALSDKGDYKAAIERFGEVARWTRSDPGLVSLSHLNAGKALDAMGKRSEAIAEYQTVLRRENVFDSHKQAGEYVKKPFVPTKG